MPDYRLYCLDEQGKFTKVHEIVASDDNQAIHIANAMNLLTDCELWNRDRIIAKLKSRSDA